MNDPIDRHDSPGRRSLRAWLADPVRFERGLGVVLWTVLLVVLLLSPF